MNLAQAKERLVTSWPLIVEECRAVFAGELHYQAIIYHCLREAGVPRTQIGMNVKQWIDSPVSDLFRQWNAERDVSYQGGVEPIPDIVLFSPKINGNWQRRNHTETCKHMLCAIEVKASERAKSRISIREIERDIAKLAAHRDEIGHLGYSMYPVMMVIDVAISEGERMLENAVEHCASRAEELGVGWMYTSRVVDSVKLN